MSARPSTIEFRAQLHHTVIAEMTVDVTEGQEVVLTYYVHIWHVFAAVLGVLNFVVTVQGRVVVYGHITVAFSALLYKVVQRIEVLHDAFYARRGICAAPHAGHMPHAVVVHWEYITQTARSVSWSEQHLYGGVSKRYGIAVADVMVDVKVLPRVRTIREEVERRITRNMSEEEVGHFKALCSRMMGNLN